MSHKKVLIVDDNQDAANIIKQLLELHGHIIETAYNGKHGIDVAREFRPDVILLDLAMPVMDGYTAATAIRQIPEIAQTVLVALTIWDDSEVRARVAAHGFDFHVTKPANLHMLLYAITVQRRAGPRGDGIRYQT